MRQVLDEYPLADISVSVVWINMFEQDCQETAGLSAAIIDDPRARHFHDPERRVGQAVAQSLGRPDKIAWDIYLFYEAGQTWDDSLPLSAHWAHQLEPEDADREHGRWGGALIAELRKIMAGFMGA